ncbi:MAG TPA: hypothetical protein VK760_04225, partial [Candidatus Acidoferrales bacterium]|nr:hypothetical protein [Candidatus Acidoferrales bacterium]
MSAASLAACSSGSVATMQPATVPPGTVLPTPSYPVGGAFSYTSRYWGVIKPGAGSTPLPFPTSASDLNERVATGASFNGHRDLIDVKTAYRDSVQVGSSDEYLQWAAVPGGQALEQIGAAFVEKGQWTGSGQTVYSVPAIEVEVPFATGRRWNGASAYRDTFSALGELGFNKILSRSDDTSYEDGSYVTRDLNNPTIEGDNIRSFDRVTSDGAEFYSSTTNGGVPYKLRVGVPKRNASGTYVIPVLDAYGVQRDIPDWYPGGALPPSPLQKTTVVDQGMETLPTACDVPRSIATQGEKIVLTSSYLEPEGAITSIVDVSYYAPGVGMVCDVESEKQLDYIVFSEPAGQPGGTFI